MKKYLIFAGSDFYPKGGYKDLIGQSSSVASGILNGLAHIKAELDKSRLSHYKEEKTYKEKADAVLQEAWIHLVNSRTGEVVWDSDQGDRYPQRIKFGKVFAE